VTDGHVDLQQIVWIPIQDDARPKKCLISKAVMDEVVKKFGLALEYESCGTLIRGHTSLCSIETNMHSYCIRFGDIWYLVWSYDAKRRRTRAIFWGTKDQISAVQTITKYLEGPAYLHGMCIGLAAILAVDVSMKEELIAIWVDLRAIEAKTGFSPWKDNQVEVAKGDNHELSRKATGIKKVLAARECFVRTASNITVFLQEHFTGQGKLNTNDAWAERATAGISHMDNLSQALSHRLEEHHNTIEYYNKRADAQLTAVS
jgi:hypothetical protein